MFVNQGRFCPAGDTGNVCSHFWLSQLGGCAPLGSSEDRAGMLQVILHVTRQAHPPQRITQPSVLSVEAEKPTRNPHTSVLPSVGAFISRGAQQYELLVSRSQLASNGSNVLISSSWPCRLLVSSRWLSAERAVLSLRIREGIVR